MKKLPRSLHRYFWDIDADKLDIERWDKYVIARILQWGRAEDLRWLRKTYGKDRLIEVVKRSRELSVKNANYYAEIWGIPQMEVVCLQPEFRLQRKMYWPR